MSANEAKESMLRVAETLKEKWEPDDEGNTPRNTFRDKVAACGCILCVATLTVQWNCAKCLGDARGNSGAGHQCGLVMDSYNKFGPVNQLTLFLAAAHRGLYQMDGYKFLRFL